MDQSSLEQHSRNQKTKSNSPQRRRERRENNNLYTKCCSKNKKMRDSSTEGFRRISRRRARRYAQCAYDSCRRQQIGQGQAVQALTAGCSKSRSGIEEMLSASSMLLKSALIFGLFTPFRKNPRPELKRLSWMLILYVTA